MKTTIRHLVGVLALGVLGWASLHASGQPQPQQGNVAILENDRVLLGQIERVGDQYRVRRSIGEMWLPGTKVRHLCASLEEAYAFLRSQANVDDPDECLRLARWCQLNGLREQALAEVTAAVQLRPSHAESQRLLRGLQRSAAETEPMPRPKEEPDAPAVPQAPVAYNAQALGPFVSRVQPILMNTCASCHASGKGGSFKLTRQETGGFLNRRTTQQNLLAVLAQLNRERPQESPFLKMALAVHGESDQPPLKGRAAPAYRILEEWAQLALTDLPRLAPTAAGPTVVGPIVETRTFAEATPRAGQPASATMPVAGASWAAQWSALPKEPPPEPAAGKRPPSSPTAPEKPPSTEAADQFDPALFNRQSNQPK